MEIKLPEACKICLANANNQDVINTTTNKPTWITNELFRPCHGCACDGGSVCLPKDRAMIVLLDKLLNK